MVRRLANDAQVERMLTAMRSVQYRSALARRVVVEGEGYKPGTADYKRRYKSVMRRFQRYVTDSGTERRSFTRAPVKYQREARAVARAIVPPETKRRELPAELAPGFELPKWYETEEKPETEEEFGRDISTYDLRAIVAYYDGDVSEAAGAMGLTARGERLLSLATEGEGVDVFRMRGAGELSDKARELIEGELAADVQDIEDFHDLLMNLPEWQIGMILDDLEDSNTTFADWLDAWRNDGMDLDTDDSEYWAIWRKAYARATA